MTDILNTAAQVGLVLCGFIVAFFEICSDEFKPGQRRHNTVRASKIGVGFLVALLGVITWYCGNRLDEEKIRALTAAQDEVLTQGSELRKTQTELSLTRQRTADLEKSAPFRIGPRNRTLLFDGVERIVKHQRENASLPMIHLVKFPGQSEDGGAFLDLLAIAFEKAGCPFKEHMVGKIKTTEPDGTPWDGVVIRVPDAHNIHPMGTALGALVNSIGLALWMESSGQSDWHDGGIVIQGHRLAVRAKPQN